MRNNRWINFVPYLIVILALFSLMNMNTGTATQNLTYNEFQKLVEEQKVTESAVTVGDNVIKIKGVFEQDGKKVGFTASVPRSETEVDALMSALEAADVKVSDMNESNLFLDTILSLIPFVIFGAMAFFLISKMNGGGNNKAFEFSKSRARLEGNIKVRFDDVAGCDEEKQEMAEIIDYLKSPKKFAKMGARIPKGILMVGSPGTGKTLLAKAVAGEADVPFYSISGSDFVEMFVGVGASRVRDMFKKAQQTAPCMIFIDEIDAVGRHRGAGMGGGHDEREQTLNQLLVEMDGFAPNEGIIIIAATNRPDILDPALLRPGRFDRQITVNYPDIKGREEILAVHSKGKPIAEDVDLHTVAKRTPYFTGADLENVMNEAAILTARKEKTEIHMQEILEAINRVTVGPEKKSSVVTEKDKKLVAYHESGHALVAHLLPNCNPVHEVSIIPRGQAGGYTMTLPTEETKYVTKSYLLDDIAMALGGRAAEEIMLGEISTGAYSDLKHATSNARRMVREYGMSEKIGSVFYGDSDQEVFLGRDFGHQKSYSEKVAADIDEEVRSILDNAMETALSLIRTHKDKMEELAEQLIVKEKLTAEEFEQIMEGKLPEAAGADEQNHKAALTEGTAQEEEKQDQTPEA